LQTDFGLQVTYDEDWAIMVAVPSSYFGATCGLCGNFNEDSEDETMLSDGTRATSLADSWKVGEVPGCSAGCVGDCPACNEEQKQPYRGDAYCGVIARAGGPFRACHPLIDPTPFLEDCAFDTCHYKGHRATLCKAIAAYVTECQSHGVGVEPWRTPSFCGPSCPRHSHYELCGSSSPAPGCFYGPGFVLSGDECVPASECGCEHRGRYYKKGEEFYASCRERCRCKAKGVVECQEVFCGAHEECRVEDGVLGCYPAGYGRLVVSGDPHYMTFDGRAFDLRGSCTYVLARLCKPERRLANFTVLLEHDVGGRGNVALMKKVVVAIHGYTVSMERGRKWEVMVSQEEILFKPPPKKLILGFPSPISHQNHAGRKKFPRNTSKTSILASNEFETRLTPGRGSPSALPSGHERHAKALIWVRKAGFGGFSIFCSQQRRPLVGRGSPVTHKDAPLDPGKPVMILGVIKVFFPFFFFPPPALSCPPHSHYELCTRTCDFTCASLSVPAPCSWTCFEGCQCDDGYLFDGEACVSLERCGC
ncbi:IgGFc-binding protein, partial [Charadrius vociferus]